MKVNKKILSTALAVLCLLSCCSFSVFAADETGAQTFDILSMSPSMYRVSTDGNTMSSYDSSIVTELKTFTDGTECVNFTNSNTDYYASGMYKAVILTDYITINPDTQYSIRFMHSLNYEALYDINVYVVVYSGSNITKIPIYSENFKGNYYYGNISDFSFKVPSSKFGNSYKCRLYIEQYVDYQQSWTGCRQIIQRYITVENDDVTWLARILNAIKAIPSNISNFFTTLGTRIGGFFDVLNTKIQNFSDSVTAKFNEIRLKIENFYLGVQQWFIDLQNTIKQKFIDLGNQIGEFFEKLKNYLLYFQHPVTTNSDGVLIGSDGKPVYTNPFESALQKVEDTVYDWLGKISDFLDSMEQSRIDVTGYLENGSALVNGVLKASPALAVCITFAVGFFVIRKVVGR